MAADPKRKRIEIDWFLPTNGDGHHLTSSGLPKVGLFQQGERAPTLDYLRQVVRAAEQAAFDGIMVPTASGFEDPWLIVALMVQEVRRLKFLLTLRPGVELPAYTAHKAATLQQLSDNRLLLHLVSGSSRFEQRALGDFLEHDERYARSAEFLDVFRATWAGREHHGRYYRTGSPVPIPREAALPPICFGGASDVAERIAASHAQSYLMWGEPPAMIRERILRMRERAAPIAARCASACACTCSPPPIHGRPGPTSDACSTRFPATPSSAPSNNWRPMNRWGNRGRSA